MGCKLYSLLITIPSDCLGPHCQHSGQHQTSQTIGSICAHTVSKGPGLRGSPQNFDPLWPTQLFSDSRSPPFEPVGLGGAAQEDPLFHPASDSSLQPQFSVARSWSSPLWSSPLPTLNPQLR